MPGEVDAEDGDDADDGDDDHGDDAEPETVEISPEPEPEPRPVFVDEHVAQGAGGDGPPRDGPRLDELDPEDHFVVDDEHGDNRGGSSA